MKTNGKFYLGKIYDPQVGRVTDQHLLYDPADLTTHAVVVGMTGSGKTGLCIDLLEEAALQHIPAIMVDPKGDITNILLHFPDLLPKDFLPWVNPDQARREGKTVEQIASHFADQARKGLSDWDISPERVRELKDAVEFTIYTPGSDAGIPVSILSTFKCPDLSWQANRESLREKISATVTALLGLVGEKEIDPVKSREHILLANIFEHAWTRHKDLDLEALILKVQTPPFQKLGVFDVNAFYPEKDRFELAMRLNNILATPAFQSWIEGKPLEIENILYTSDGRPRHSVFYIAHLNDQERMFFVSLLFSAIETWMRSQPGTLSLRALVYFDEIYGYLPPIRNPSSKQPMLRMLKQARAFGVGLVLVTQNPVDLDYKALTNTGSWFIGKLQTDQDKQRLLDGLESAIPGGLERGVVDRLITTLGKRVFMLHNVHEKQPVLFKTRWAMNFMAGPLTRAQIPQLIPDSQRIQMGFSAQSQSTSHPSPLITSPSVEEFQSIRVFPTIEEDWAPKSTARNLLGIPLEKPILPSGVHEYFLLNNLTFAQAFMAAGRSFPMDALSGGLIYRPALLAQAEVRFLNRKYKLDIRLQKTILVPDPDRRGLIKWDNYPIQPVALADLMMTPDPQGFFSSIEAPFTDVKIMASMQKNFLDWVYSNNKAVVRANEALKLYAGPEVSAADFIVLCADTARQGREVELRKIVASFDTKILALQKKQIREQHELEDDRSELSQRRKEELSTHAENFLGIFGGRPKRRLSSSATKHRLTVKAKADMKESVATIEALRQQIRILMAQREKAMTDVNRAWGVLAAQIVEIPISPYKKDVILDLFGVAWIPYHIVKSGDRTEELSGYGGM